MQFTQLLSLAAVAIAPALAEIPPSHPKAIISAEPGYGWPFNFVPLTGECHQSVTPQTGPFPIESIHVQHAHCTLFSKPDCAGFALPVQVPIPDLHKPEFGHVQGATSLRCYPGYP